LQLESFLEASAQRCPDKTALIVDGRRIGYGDIERRANQLAHALVERGVDRGDRVAIWLENSSEVIIALFAALKVGAVFVLVSPGTKGHKAAYILNDCRPRALITDRRRLRVIGEHWAGIPPIAVVWTVDPVADTAAPPHVTSLQAVFDDRRPQPGTQKRAIDLDLASLIYTSGSTGTPKGVMMTHLNMISAATSIASYLESDSDDVVLNVLPLSFDYGLYQILMAFRLGATVLLERSFAFPHLVLDAAARERITVLPLVPTIASMLLRMDISRYDLSSLRCITNTGAALPPEHSRRLQESFPNARIFSMYGLTECKRVSYLPPDQLTRRPTSVGRGMPNQQISIVDEEGRAVAAGAVGELVVRGPHVMKGYWGDPEETAKRLRPGPYEWEEVLYTGDLFRTDDEGYLYFVGRKDDMIKSRGEKVSPKEIEDVLYSIDGVAEAAVLGVPDPVLGQAITAVIARCEGSRLTEQDVLRLCAERLEDFMVPTTVTFRDTLPKTSSSKINKRMIAV